MIQKQHDRQQDQSSDEGTDTVEGEASDIVHSDTLGDKRYAPDGCREKKQY